MSFWFSTWPLADTGTDYNLFHHYYLEEEYNEHIELLSPPHPPPDNGDIIGSNRGLCLPKAEFKTKNSTERQLSCRLVEFLVFNSIH